MTLVRNHGVTAPAGFRASAVDGSVAVLVNEGPDLTAAGLFPAGQPTAAMLWTEQVLRSGRLRAVLLHATSSEPTLPDDFAVTHRAAERLAETLSSWGTTTGAGEVAVCATGGTLAPEALDADVAEAVHELAGGISGGYAAARTGAGPRGTPAQAAMQHADGWTVGGMSAAQGWVCVLSTDAVADVAMLLDVLNQEQTANTTVLLLASGASEISCAAEQLGSAVAAVRADLCARAGQLA